MRDRNPMIEGRRLGCRCNPVYLLDCAEAALSPRVEAEQEQALFAIAPNPFPDGRARETARRRELRLEHAAALIWC